MKKTIIGGILMLSGVLNTIGIIIAAAIFTPSITSWSGSRFWFAIFGGKQYGSNVVQSLFLGVPFVIGILFIAAGLGVLIREYFDCENKK